MAGGAEIPRMIIDEDVDVGLARTVERMDRAIHAQPEAFLGALRELGETATQGTIGLEDIDQQTATLVRTPSKLLQAYFKERYDHGITFDDATEDAIGRNSLHRELVGMMRGMKSQRLQTGSMSSKVRAHPEAVGMRDTVRRHRLELYLKRVVAYNRLQRISGSERNEGEAS